MHVPSVFGLTAALLVSLAACGEDVERAGPAKNEQDGADQDAGTQDADIELTDLPSDRAPSDVKLIPAWLAQGAYKGWDCQTEPHPALAPSPHGDNRICQNQIVSAALAESGAFPLGATLVKEVYRNGKLDVLAVETRVAGGAPEQSWLYFEGRDGEALYAGLGIAVCTTCHSGAERDYVWSVVK